MIIYFRFVLGIGFILKRFMRTNSEAPLATSPVLPRPYSEISARIRLLLAGDMKVPAEILGGLAHVKSRSLDLAAQL
jgi:hypothetical protein